MTWNSGLRPRSRSGRRCRTSSSNGVSLCRWVSVSSACVSRSASASVVAGVVVRRKGRLLTRNPMTSVVSGWVRPVTGMPIVTSCPPVSLASSTVSAVVTTANAVVPVVRARLSTVVSDSAIGTAAPVQCARSSAGVVRCQRTTSPYCIGAGAADPGAR